MTKRERVMKMAEAIEGLPESELAAVERFIAFVRWQADPVKAALDNAPIDDEPETEEEAAGAAEAWEEYRRGEARPLHEIREELARDAG